MKKYVLMLLFLLVVFFSTSCGFHLRGYMQDSKKIKMLILNYSDYYESLIHSLNEQLYLNNIYIVENMKVNNILSLRIISSNENQETISILKNGKTAEYQMILNIKAEVIFPNNHVYPLSIIIFHSFFNNSLNILSHDSEKEMIRQEMYSQAAKKIVNILLIIYSKIT